MTRLKAKKTSIILQYKQLRDREEALLFDYENLGTAVISKKPDGQSWALREISHHLMLVESGIFDAIQKNLSDPSSPKQAGVRSQLSLWLIKRLLNGVFRFKVPVKRVLPREDVRFDEVRSAWQDLHARWPVVIENLNEDLLNSKVFKHPVFGWLSLSQTIQFLISHTDHHLAQVERTRKMLGLSKGDND